MKFFLFLSVTCVLVGNLVFALSQRPCDSDFNCVQNYLKSVFDENLSKSERLRNINNVREFLSSLEKTIGSDAIVISEPGKCYKLSQNLWKGNLFQNGEDVKTLQKFLLNRYISQSKSAGVCANESCPLPPEVNGIFDERTEYWVKQFQFNFYIKQTGAVGPQTLTKINSLICGGNVVSACTTEYAPVCGRYICPPTGSCDGTPKTFSNSCLARQANYEVISKGVCEDTISACTREYSPVCAKYTGSCGENAKCDYFEKTYSNSCEARKAGKTILYKGVCEGTIIN